MIAVLEVLGFSESPGFEPFGFEHASGLTAIKSLNFNL